MKVFKPKSTSMPVYCITDLSRTWCKIGFVNEIERVFKRIDTLQTACPFRLDVVGIRLDLDKYHEQALHLRFAGHGTGGGLEWFYVEPIKQELKDIFQCANPVRVSLDHSFAKFETEAAPELFKGNRFYAAQMQFEWSKKKETSETDRFYADRILEVLEMEDGVKPAKLLRRIWRKKYHEKSLFVIAPNEVVYAYRDLRRNLVKNAPTSWPENDPMLKSPPNLGKSQMGIELDFG